MEGEEREGAWLCLSLCSARNARSTASREEGASFYLRAQRTHSLSPFASPPSLSLKTKLPLSARIKLESP